MDDMSQFRGIFFRFIYRVSQKTSMRKLILLYRTYSFEIKAIVTYFALTKQYLKWKLDFELNADRNVLLITFGLTKQDAIKLVKFFSGHGTRYFERECSEILSRFF